MPDKALKTVVLVDDDPLDRQVMARTLKELDVDLELIEVGDPLSAIQTIEGQSPDLTLLDIRMPIMDGFEILQTWKSRQTNGAAPVLILSSSAFEGDQVRARELGADGYYTKPASLSGYRSLAEDLKHTYLREIQL
ncbi:MAG: response regulator [Devosiaceae bacterium]|nr:response regulator [Devosiaceae bacterium MH13]